MLSNGENIEPSPIEDAMLSCKLIDQVVLTGQDKKRLSAITVLNPQELTSRGFFDNGEGEKIQELVDIINDPHCSKEDYEQASGRLQNCSQKIKSDKKLLALINDEVKHLLKNYRKWEQVGSFNIILEPVSVADINIRLLLFCHLSTN